MQDITLDETLREAELENTALRKISSDAATREGLPNVASSVLIEGRRTFRGMNVLEQLPTRGAEADIYLLQGENDEQHILKLYRHRMEPKIKILKRVEEISRANSRFFVVFRDSGFDEETGRWYELQEYFHLGSLKDVSTERKRNPAFVKDLVSELSGALHCLHENGIIHCDVKPGNVLVRSFEPLELVLTDFGISSLMASGVTRKMTSLKGTPMYWAPEAFSRLVGRPGDWWGLGMIALESLVGVHPFEELTDSQITHKLTIENVEIPNSLDEDWSLLLQGLLTKDDSKRWGYDEIVRWLAGERDIPVYREASPVGAQKRTMQPFRFDGKEYYSPEALARSLYEREQPWTDASRYLRYIRSWLEDNMLFDEAMKLAKDADKMESEVALFHFIYTYAKLPFAYLGKRLDQDSLKLILARVTQGEASFTEQRIVRMLNDGSFVPLYEIYRELMGRISPFLLQMFLAMKNWPAYEQWRCIETLEQPDAYLWPKDLNINEIDVSNTKQMLSALQTLRASPLKHGDAEDLRKSFHLPAQFFHMLDSTETFSSTKQWLEMQQKKGLLIPKDMDSYEAIYENISFDDYVARARMICFGHSEAFYGELRTLEDQINDLPRPSDERSATILQRVRDRLNWLRQNKVNSFDAVYIKKMLLLFSKRSKLFDSWRIMCPISSLFGTSALWILFAMMNEQQKDILTYTLITLTFLLYTYLFLSSRQHLLDYFSNSTDGRRGYLFTALILSVLGMIILLYRVLRARSFPETLLLGAAFSCAVYSFFSRYTLSHNMEDILKICSDYCATPLNQETFQNQGYDRTGKLI